MCEPPGIGAKQARRGESVPRGRDVTGRHSGDSRHNVGLRVFAEHGDGCAVARSRGDSAARRRVITSRASPRTCGPEPTGKLSESGPWDANLMTELADQPGIAMRSVVTAPADFARSRRRGASDQLRRASDSQGPQGERPCEAAIADQREQIRRGIGNVGSERENDEHGDVAHPPGEVIHHSQRRSVGPLAIVDDEHHRRVFVGHCSAQPEDAVGDAGRRVRPWHGPAE